MSQYADSNVADFPVADDGTFTISLDFRKMTLQIVGPDGDPPALQSGLRVRLVSIPTPVIGSPPPVALGPAQLPPPSLILHGAPRPSPMEVAEALIDYPWPMASRMTLVSRISSDSDIAGIGHIAGHLETQVGEKPGILLLVDGSSRGESQDLQNAVADLNAAGLEAKMMQTGSGPTLTSKSSDQTE